MAISDELRKLVDPNNECCCEHSLGNKCKEWAFDEGYSISVWKERVIGYYSEITSKLVNFNYTGEILSNNINIKDINFTDKFESEPEYIFKACQWILDNKDKQ